MGTYEFREIERKWQHYWKAHRSFVAEKKSDKPKYYVLDMFPYPSGKGLHVGHPLGYIATDIVARYKRNRGFNVLHPMGFDAFGLPAEQYAIRTGIHPAVTTEKNIERYLAQMSNLGFHYDPDALLSTSYPDFYRWTQWIFIQLFKHWYDKSEEKAYPIETLIRHFEKEGNKNIVAATSFQGTFTAEEWNGYTAKQQADKLMHYRLAYLDFATVNWCPALGTVLANEEVKDGKSERGGHPVERKQMRQWMLRITAYADRLLAGLDQIDWSDAMKTMQRNWIGRSEGANIFYQLDGHDAQIEVFTTRPDTIFGNTFMVLAPEHPLVPEITTPEQAEEVNAYQEWAENRAEKERIADTTKTGVWTGAYAINPFTEEKLPVWISDYVVITYGTGAIMCVPAHDQRDYEFAGKFGLPIKEVIAGGDISKEAFTSKDGTMVNSGFLSGMKVPAAISAIVEKIREKGIGNRQITYRQRDVIWSRQRYWGEPTPIYYQDGIAYPLDDKDLPLELPEIETYKPSPTGEPPLSRATEWVNLPHGATRDLNTMPGLAGSSWYFLRYPDAHNTEAPFDPETANYWMPVDLYVGGTEHAVGHLMYSRFWTKFLFDLGYVNVEEPFEKLVNQGMIQGTSQLIYRDPQSNEYLSADLLKDAEKEQYSAIHVEVSLVKNQLLDVEGFKAWTQEHDAVFRLNDKGECKTDPLVEKMSKSKYNTVDPDDMCDQYGADTLRMYEMFLGPIELSKPWNTEGISGVFTFLKRTWNLFWNEQGNWQVTDQPANQEELKFLHQMIKKVEEGIERLAFNTCVPAFMVFVKEIARLKTAKKEILEPFLICLAPFAPHICEELWQGMGHERSILEAAWPAWDESYLLEDMIEYPVQINGKVRFKIKVPADMQREAIGDQAIQDEQAQKYLEGKSPKKIIVVPGRIVNLVV